VSITGIISSALTTIQTNSAALRTTSANVANVGVEGYHRRVIGLETLASGGQLAGVAVGEVRRIADIFFAREAVLATAGSARYEAQAGILDRLDAALGRPGDGQSIPSRLDSLYAALGQVALDPASYPQRQSVLTEMSALAKNISGLSQSISQLRADADSEIAAAVVEANALIKRIHELNPSIQSAFASGNTATGLLDQRDQAVEKLAQVLGIRTLEQPDGRLFVSTIDGISLVSDMYSQLDYAPSGSGPTYGTLAVQRIHTTTGQPIGSAQVFDEHSGSGRLRGLLDMRDGALADIAEELGALAQGIALAFNAAHNAGAAFPPPDSLTGRSTGLLSGDSLGFAGATTIGVANAGGVLVSRIDVDFDAGTLSVDGGAPASIGTTVGSFVTALDTALGANGGASFVDGVLTISGTTGGIVIADEAGNGAARGGNGFSHFFGLNDIFESGVPAITATGLASGDAHGLVAGGQLGFVLKGPEGQRVSEVGVTVSGTTIGNMVSALNTAFAGNATFALDADGRLAMTPAAQYAGYRLEVTADTTIRGTTGLTFTQLFGLGSGSAMAQAAGLRVRDDLIEDPARLAFAAPMIASGTSAGDTVVSRGDNRGALALQLVSDTKQAFQRAGSFGARTATLFDYAASFYQDVGSRGATAESRRDAEAGRLLEAQSRRAKSEGVNLDEELTNMMLYQQAYNAGARMLRTVQELLDELLNVV